MSATCSSDNPFGALLCFPVPLSPEEVENKARPSTAETYVHHYNTKKFRKTTKLGNKARKAREFVTRLTNRFRRRGIEDEGADPNGASDPRRRRGFAIEQARVSVESTSRASAANDTQRIGDSILVEDSSPLLEENLASSPPFRRRR